MNEYFSRGSNSSQMGSALKRKNLPLNPIALRKDKIVYNFGLSECNRVKEQIEKNLFRRVLSHMKTNKKSQKVVSL